MSPANLRTRAHTLLTLGPFGPSFILIYEPPHSHSAVASLHRSLKVDKKLSRCRRTARMRMHACVRTGSVAASDGIRPAQEGGQTTE